MYRSLIFDKNVDSKVLDINNVYEIYSEVVLSVYFITILSELW